MIIWLCLAVFLATCFLTYLIHHYVVAKSLIDIPNARSSHSIPTPRGGGLSIVIVCLVPFLLFGILTGFDTPECGEIADDTKFWAGAALFSALFAVAGIGFGDDHRHIPARWRLLVHFSAAALALLNINLPVISGFGFSLENQWLLGCLYLFGLVWLLNLYNFMDGIDGIASIEAITVALGAAALLWIHQAESGADVLLVFFASSIAGFLVWNFPHAKIFMGDACSGFLGFSLGLFALITSATGAINIWSWLILLAVFITDATITLIKRILNKQVWYEAHSSHAYQHYARQLTHTFQQQGFDHRDARTRAHRGVNLMMTVINLFWLFPLATAAMFYPLWAALIAVIAFTPLIFIANALNAGVGE